MVSSVDSFPVTEDVRRRQYPLADGYVRNDAVYQMRCCIRDPSASTRRAYVSGLAGERHDAVQPAGVASDPEEATGEHAAIENDRNSFSMKRGTCRS